jgi:hypothetical protein
MMKASKISTVVTKTTTMTDWVMKRWIIF